MIYTYADIKTAVDNRLHDKITLGFITATNVLAVINTAVKSVWGTVDIRTAKRKSTLSPRLFNDVYTYTCPTDLKGFRLLDIRPQADKETKPEWRLTTDEEFDRRKASSDALVAIYDADGTRKIKISANIDDDASTLSPLDTLTSGGGTWTLFGDGTNLTKDASNYIQGSASINWDISAAGGTTAGIYNSGLDVFDLTDYLTAGSAFVWVYLTSETNVTNFILRIGSSSANYYSMTATTANDSTAFVTGWQLVRFDFSGKSETGTVDDDGGDYVAIYMTKTAGKVSETDYRFDYLVLRKGDIWNVHYYSKYPWQSSTGTYLQDSTATTDYINADSDEYDLVVEKCVEQVGYSLREYQDATVAKQNFTEMLVQYRAQYPSEAMVFNNTYYNLGSIDGAWYDGRIR